jgi:hypothetical protein
MLATVKAHVRDILMDSYLWNLRETIKEKREVAEWEKAGKPAPPPAVVKRQNLAAFGAAFGISTLVETGTFMGGTMYALKDQFKTLYSIELSPELVRRARRRFSAFPQINILEGDSGEVLGRLIPKFTEPALFWLDGHYSGGITALAQIETPIVKELRTILEHPVKNHVILIDDARLFDGTHDYPTIDELRQLIATERPDYDFAVVCDVIRMHPRRIVNTPY